MVLLVAVANKILGRKDPETELLRAAEQIAIVISKAPKASIQGRVARACMVKALPSYIITKLKKSGRLSVVIAAKLNLTGEVQRRAYRDYNSMVEGVLLKKAEQSRKRYDDNALTKAVKYMLLPSNVGALSWGTREVRLSQNEVITLPTLVRRVPLDGMYEGYLHVTEGDDKSSIPPLQSAAVNQSYLLQFKSICRSWQAHRIQLSRPLRSPRSERSLAS
jgi:hypothetical protein